MASLAADWQWRSGAYGPACSGSLVERLLQARGLALSERDKFLLPTMEHLEGLEQMPGAQKVAARLLAALRRDASIAIHGDYDADGVCAAALLLHALRAIQPSARLQILIPHRVLDGFGIAEEAVNRLSESGVEVIVTVDCGANSPAAAKRARELGIELLITDHHEPKLNADGSQQWPDAAAIAHPHLHGRSPEAHLPSGSGVAWMVAQALVREANAGGTSPHPQQLMMLTQLLGLVAIGTIADVMPLLGDNRTLTACGIRTLRSTRLTGLRALLQVPSHKHREFDCQFIGWKLGPSINASGRMGHAQPMADLLAAPMSEPDSAVPASLRAIAEQAVIDNQMRREATATLEAAALEQLEQSDHSEQSDQSKKSQPQEIRGAIVLADPSWPLGILGLGCARLADRFGVPAVLLTELETADGALLKGSCRSVLGYSILEGLRSCADLLVSFGGHPGAAGVSLKPADLSAFRKRLTAHALAGMPERNSGVPVTQLFDAVAQLHEVSDVNQLRELARMAPFGAGNPLPVLRLDNLTIEVARTMGADASHLSLDVKSPGNSPRLMRCVWFGAGNRVGKFVRGRRINLLARASINSYNGKETPQLQLVDAQFLG